MDKLGGISIHVAHDSEAGLDSGALVSDTHWPLGPKTYQVPYPSRVDQKDPLYTQGWVLPQRSFQSESFFPQ